MRAQILTGHELTTGRRKPSDLVAEYEAKREGAAGALEAWRAAQSAVTNAATIGGAYHALDDLRPRWEALPAGSFRESGTGINTVVMRAWA